MGFRSGVTAGVKNGKVCRPSAPSLKARLPKNGKSRRNHFVPSVRLSASWSEPTARSWADDIQRDDMAKKTLADYAQERFEEARRNLGLAATDFSIPDEKLLEIRESVRREADEARRLKKKKGFLGLFGL
jgi:hypothetical protein